MSNKIKIPVARLQQIILEEVSRFYNLEEMDELDEEDDLLEEEEIEEVATAVQQKERIIGALSAMTPEQVNALATKSGMKV